jgi:SAM-dependent methyltransferase
MASNSILACPKNHARLRESGEGLECPDHGVTYRRNAHGYYDFTASGGVETFESTSAEYAEDQQANWERFFQNYLEPWLANEPYERVLEVGCGLGMGIRSLLAKGKDAYGLDIPCLSPFWANIGNSPDRFFCADGAAMPFTDGAFDAVYSLGVIEHIGTAVGHYTLNDGFQAARQAFADEILRVTKPGGRILISCPNKSFPIDIAHEPTDDATPPGTMRFRRWIYDRTGMTVHLPFGKYHLLSFGEVRNLFRQAGSVRPLSNRGYFSFSRFGSGPFGLLKPLVAGYVNSLPALLRVTCLNPFVVAEVRR